MTNKKVLTTEANVEVIKIKLHCLTGTIIYDSASQGIGKFKGKNDKLRTQLALRKKVALHLKSMATQHEKNAHKLQ